MTSPLTLEEVERLEGLLAACPHQSAWIWQPAHKLITTANGGVVLGVGASATCGRSGDDYYACQRPTATAHLTLKGESAELLVAAVNALPALLSQAKRVGELEEALRACRIELACCAKQLAAHGRTGHPGDSVDRALEAARAALSTGGGQ